jgi:hypothetical protein
MHLILPWSVGDEDFCVGIASAVRKAYEELPLVFCLVLLELAKRATSLQVTLGAHPVDNLATVLACRLNQTSTSLNVIGEPKP